MCVGLVKMQARRELAMLERKQNFVDARDAAAADVCPMLVLTDPRAQKRLRCVLARNAAVSASSSMGSPAVSLSMAFDICDRFRIDPNRS